MYFTNNTLRIAKKVLVCILILIILSISLCSNLNTSYAVELMPESDQYLEFRVVSVKPYVGKDKQVIAELWAYNIEFQGFDLSLHYDPDKLMPSDIETNDYITPEKAGTENLSMFWAEEEFGDDLDMWLFDYVVAFVRYVFSLLFPIQSNNENINIYPDNRATLKADGNGVLLGKYSYRLFNGTVDETTFELDTTDPYAYLPTGIQVNLSDTDIITDPSVFRITLDYASNNANLSDIKIDDEAIANFIEDLDAFDENILDYELEILEEKEEISLKPILADDKATMVVQVEVLDPNNEGQYIYEEIEINEEDEDYIIPLNSLGEETKIRIIVTAEDGEATKTYAITIKQACGGIIGSVTAMDWNGKNKAYIKIYEKGIVDWENLYGHDDLDEIEPIVNIITNDDGTYEIRLVPGEYDLLIDKPGYLDYIIVNILIEKDITIDLGNIELIAGDINKDGFISFEDLTYININYGAEEGDSEYSESCDFESKGYVGLEDLTLINQNYDSERKIIIY